MNIKIADRTFRVLFVFIFVIGIAGMPATTGMAESPCPSSMVSYWKGDGDTTDSVGGNHGSLYGATYSTGKVGQSFATNINQYVEVPDNSNLHIPQNITIEAWVNPSTSDYDRVILSKGNSGTGDGWHMMLRENNTLAVHARYGSAWEITQTVNTIPIGTWHHVAYTFDGSQAKLYINGVFEAGRTFSDPIQQNTRPLKIGTVDQNTHFFVGFVDEVAIYNGVLSESELSAHYQKGMDGLSYCEESIPNRPPIAEAGGPYTAILNQPFMLDASASSDPDGDTLSYWWDLDNDGEYDDLGGPMPFTTFDQTGEFTIGLQVSDVFGMTSTDTAIVTVNPPTPFKLNIRAYIDGVSQLIVRDNNVYWHHDWADAPGRTGGHDDPTYINGISWYPTWPDVPDERNRDCHCGSSAYTGLNPALPQHEQFQLNVIQARHAVSLVQQPTAGNDYTLIVNFDDGPPGGGEWYEVELAVDSSVHTPAFVAYYEEDYIEGGGWSEGAAVTLTVDDPATPLSPDHTATEIVSRKGDPSGTIWVQFWTGGIIDIQPGFVITLSDGIYTKSTIVTNLKITHLDLALDRVEGTGDPGRIVDSWVCKQGNCEEAIGRSVTPDASGYWLADYSQTNNSGEETYDIKPGDGCEIVQIDEDGDLTEIRLRVPSPHFWVIFPRNAVHGYNWPMGADITLTIDDPSNGIGVDYSRTKTVGTENFRPPFDTWIGFQLIDFAVKPGDIVTMTDGTTTRTHVTQELTVTNIDPVADTVSGTAAPGADVGVNGGCDNNGCTYRNIPVDASGHWLADFSVPGDDDNEEAIFDIRLGSSGHAERVDDDGDATVYDWELGDPRIFALLGEQRVHAWGWMAGTLLTLTIDNPATPQSPDYTGTQEAPAFEGWDHGADWGIAYDIQPGYLIKVSGGGLTKELAVAHLSVTNVDIEADTVSGTGDPGYEIHVGMLCDDYSCTRRNIYVDADGTWFADFSVPGHDEDETVFDIRAGSGTGVYQIDEDNDATNVGWNVPNHTFSVRTNDDWIEGFEWIVGSTITIEIDDPATQTNPDFTDAATVGVANWDPSQTYFGISTAGYDLKLGDKVTVSDGDITKQLVITDFKITDVDLDTDVVYGQAGPNQNVDVWTCWQNDPCINRNVRADQNGNWFENFGIAGDEDWEQETADLRLGSWIDSSARDDDGDTVMFGWYVPNNRPPIADAGTDQSVYALDPVTLDASTSSDPDADPLFYEWDLNNDGQYQDASGVTVTTMFSQPGIYDIGLRVIDGDGLSSTDIVTITVLPWDLSGFYQPLDMNGVYNTVKGGSTVPLRFEIFAGPTELIDTTTVRSLTYAQVSCDANAITDAVESLAIGNTVLHYDITSGQFIYNWKTPKMPGKCFRIMVTTIENSALVAYFKLK